MKRHVLVGRYGSGDRASVAVGGDEAMTRLDLLSAGGAYAWGVQDALRDLARVGLQPSELGVDILTLAIHVQAADTRIPRATQAQDSWTREIRIVVPVSSVELWASVAATLELALRFLTGDIWRVGFRPRPKARTKIGGSVRIPRGRTAQKFDGVALFSGGLDSLIGAINLLESGARPLFISHVGEAATSTAQQACFDALCTHYRISDASRLRVATRFPKTLVRKGGGPENSTRGRSFFFFALAAFAGSALGTAYRIVVPENGLMSLNVPLDPLRLGALSTRTTHPFYMARWGELLQRLGTLGTLENPYWNKTKGEMIRECTHQALLRSLIPSSMSCSSPSKGRWQGRGVEHCGYCLPCLVRRAALVVGLDDRDPTRYTLGNLRRRALDTNEAIGQQVRSFQFANSRLEQTPGIERMLIHKPGSLTDDPSRWPELAGVYRRGMTEVAALLQDVRTRPA